MCVAAGNHKKSPKIPYFEGLRSFKIIDVDTDKKLVTVATRDNCGKITTFNHCVQCYSSSQNHFSFSFYIKDK